MIQLSLPLFGPGFYRSKEAKIQSTRQAAFQNNDILNGYLKDWCNWAGNFSAILCNWCQSVTSWNLALDEQGRPNIGPFPCGGVVTIDSNSRAITRCGQYWAFAHYARAIRRGARRFESQSSVAGVQHVALENRDGQRVLVLTNSGEATKVEIRLANLAASVALPTDSVTTLAWK